MIQVKKVLKISLINGVESITSRVLDALMSAAFFSYFLKLTLKGVKLSEQTILVKVTI